MKAERRVNRSENTMKSLVYQLAATAERAACSALVLTEKSGLVVAEVGDDPAAEEIAAYAPCLARGGLRWHGMIPTSSGERLVTITPLASESGALFLCAVGGQFCVLGSELLLSGRGIVRILS